MWITFIVFLLTPLIVYVGLNREDIEDSIETKFWGFIILMCIIVVIYIVVKLLV